MIIQKRKRAAQNQTRAHSPGCKNDAGNHGDYYGDDHRTQKTRFERALIAHFDCESCTVSNSTHELSGEFYLSKFCMSSYETKRIGPDTALPSHTAERLCLSVSSP